MNKSESSKVTGISDITGKVVRVRHANEADMVFIEEKMKAHRLDTENLHHNEFVIATENSEIVGFGRLKKTGEMYEIGCVIVIEKEGGGGTGSLIIKHLIDYSPLKKVYVVTDQIDCYKNLGFVEVQEGINELVSSLGEACKTTRGKAIIMVYEKIND